MPVPAGSNNQAHPAYSLAFAACCSFVIDRLEGGSREVTDSGGLTKFGISQRAFPGVDIRALTREAAVEASEAVLIDYDVLPAVTDVHAATAAGAPAVCEQAPDNVAAEMRHGDAAACAACASAAVAAAAAARAASARAAAASRCRASASLAASATTDGANSISTSASTRQAASTDTPFSTRSGASLSASPPPPLPPEALAASAGTPQRVPGSPRTAITSS